MMAVRAEARELVEIIAGPLTMGENVKAALSRVARVTGLGERRVRGIWHNEARSIRADEMDRLRQTVLDVRVREHADAAYAAHLARLSAARAALRIPSQDGAGNVDHGGFGLAGAPDRPVARGAAR